MKNDTHKGKSSKKMKNCRRWRRRSANLNNEFKDKKGWLETHIWHAKRCKMTEYWGFKVAAHLNEKCLKSTYRSSIKGSLLHDFSYWHPFWLNDCNLEKLHENYGSDDIIDFILEHENIQLCPIKIIIKTFPRPLMFLHPAAIQTGIINHDGFKIFLENFNISFSPASDEICTFKLNGPKSESVLSQFLNLKNLPNFPSLVTFEDPRLKSEKEANNLSLVELEGMFERKEIIKTDNAINHEKSSLLISKSFKFSFLISTSLSFTLFLLLSLIISKKCINISFSSPSKYSVPAINLYLSLKFFLINPSNVTGYIQLIIQINRVPL